MIPRYLVSILRPTCLVLLFASCTPSEYPEAQDARDIATKHVSLAVPSGFKRRTYQDNGFMAARYFKERSPSDPVVISVSENTDIPVLKDGSLSNRQALEAILSEMTHSRAADTDDVTIEQDMGEVAPATGLPKERVACTDLRMIVGDRGDQRWIGSLSLQCVVRFEKRTHVQASFVATEQAKPPFQSGAGIGRPQRRYCLQWKSSDAGSREEQVSARSFYSSRTAAAWPSWLTEPSQ